MERQVVTFSRNVFIPLTTVCRNRCGYCGFRTPAEAGSILTPEEVMALIDRGAVSGCTEALFTFGERPEEEVGFPALLQNIGYDSILEYCTAMCVYAIAQGLLPHTNAGVLTFREMERLRAVNASMGLMLETTASLPAHALSPGKVPAERIRTIEEAGRLQIPFTTGLLIGIGETMEDREESLMQIADLHRKWDHIQEVIIQNFCPKSGTPMAASPVPDALEMCMMVTLARDILPEEIAIQVAPNLTDAPRLVCCGANDLGGISPVTVDYINPEHPWPHLDELRAALPGFTMQERLCIYPRFIRKGWYHPRIEALIKLREQELREAAW
ncbi:MAG: 7,8-didemethyl-8-hydroxy-5-deazariboflavin synthase CofG [Methanomicrobiales archaeon]|nr:7,8-didemethyl-8-hydroxy-5-deazariboflavin synthase CofG [Methanomicrobiales archaeon]